MVSIICLCSLFLLIGAVLGAAANEEGDFGGPVILIGIGVIVFFMSLGAWIHG